MRRFENGRRRGGRERGLVARAGRSPRAAARRRRAIETEVSSLGRPELHGRRRTQALIEGISEGQMLVSGVSCSLFYGVASDEVGNSVVYSYGKGKRGGRCLLCIIELMSRSMSKFFFFFFFTS